MTSAPQVDSLIGQLYEGALQGGNWLPFVELTARTMGAECVGLCARAPSQGDVMVCSRVEEARVAQYRKLHGSSDPVQSFLAQYEPGEAIVYPMVGSREDARLADFYRRVLRPLGWGHLFACRMSSAGEAASLTVWRSAGRSSFTPAELDSLRVICGHLERVVRVWQIVAKAFRPAYPLPRELRERFGLTPKETEVAGEIVRGRSINAVAVALGVGRETVRFHLKALFQKTNTHSQTELLLALLATDDGATGIEDQRSSVS